MFTRVINRQKIIDNINNYVEGCFSGFDKREISKMKRQIKSLSEKDRETLFVEEFWEYKILRFGKKWLDVDEHNDDEYKTFKKFNDVLKMAFLAIDYEKSLLL